MSTAGVSSAGLSNAPATTQREHPAKLLPTTVIGSFAVPEWLGQLRNDYYQLRQLTGDAARGKLAAMVAGADQVRAELT
jgi:hypothetical protein